MFCKLDNALGNHQHSRIIISYGIGAYQFRLFSLRLFPMNICATVPQRLGFQLSRSQCWAVLWWTPFTTRHFVLPSSGERAVHARTKTEKFQVSAVLETKPNGRRSWYDYNWDWALISLLALVLLAGIVVWTNVHQLPAVTLDDATIKTEHPTGPAEFLKLIRFSQSYFLLPTKY
jgi:hypothetical protein